MKKKIKGLDPLTGALSTISLMKDMILGKSVPGREDVFRNEIGKVIVDTVKAFDTGTWETGIFQSKWVIVEQYESRKLAEKGHKKWVKGITNNPTMKIEDIDLWNLKGR